MYALTEESIEDLGPTRGRVCLVGHFAHYYHINRSILSHRSLICVSDGHGRRCVLYIPLIIDQLQ